MNLYFKDYIHKQELIKKLQELNQIHDNGNCDRYYLSALYILTSDEEFRSKSYRFIKDGINFDSIARNNDFSTGYRCLLNLAWNLFNYQKKIDIADLLDRLDSSMFQLMHQAILLRRFGLKFSDLNQS